MFFKKKIKETPKGRLYGRNTNTTNYSVWDGMSFIEQIAMIGLPCMLVFIVYMMLEMFGISLWWVRLLLSVGVVTGVMTIMTLIINYFHEM
jgi:hypothetical protein